MQVKSIAEWMEHSAVLLTYIELPHGFKTIVLSIFESRLYKIHVGYIVQESTKINVQYNTTGHSQMALQHFKHYLLKEWLLKETR